MVTQPKGIIRYKDREDGPETNLVMEPEPVEVNQARKWSKGKRGIKRLKYLGDDGSRRKTRWVRNVRNRSRGMIKGGEGCYQLQEQGPKSLLTKIKSL